LVPSGTLYSSGVLKGETLYISGLQGTDPRTHQLPKDFNQEAKNCLENVGRVLHDGGMGHSDAVSVQIYLVDITQFPKVNALYKEYFQSPLPARTTVQVAQLSLGSHIEIAAVPPKIEKAGVSVDLLRADYLLLFTGEAFCSVASKFFALSGTGTAFLNTMS
jgi:2-iminobutanoate/2-iminopropanoate deaminase